MVIQRMLPRMRRRAPWTIRSSLGRSTILALLCFSCLFLSICPLAFSASENGLATHRQGIGVLENKHFTSDHSNEILEDSGAESNVNHILKRKLLDNGEQHQDVDNLNIEDLQHQKDDGNNANSVDESVLSLRTCYQTVKSWHMQELKDMENEMEGYDYKTNQTHFEDANSLLFFLHVPRTGGRTHHSCFLRSLFPPYTHCPRSYDALRLNLDNPNCNLFTSHDDYSVVKRLHRNPNPQFSPKTYVISNIRNPLERILSSYEFMVENAARNFSKIKFFFQDRGHKISFDMNSREGAADRRLNVQRRRKPPGVQTKNVWPWSEVLPMMENDMLERRKRYQARHVMLKESDGDEDDTNEISHDDYDDYDGHDKSKENDAIDSYNIPNMVMPLKEYIKHEKVKALLHNGATYQIAGITSNSILDESKAIRNCVLAFPELEKYVFDVAKTRLTKMLTVGLSDFHVKNMYLLAKILNKNLSSPVFNARNSKSSREELKNEENKVVQESEKDDRKSTPDRKFMNRKHENNRLRRNILQEKEAEQKNSGEDNTDVSSPPPPPPRPPSIFLYYTNCVNRNREMYKKKSNALHQTIPQINFTKEGRKRISYSILNEILELNQWDLKLYEYAKILYKNQLEYFFNEKAEIETTRQLKEFDLSQENFEDENIVSRNGSDSALINKEFMDQITLVEKSIDDMVGHQFQDSKPFITFDSLSVMFLISLTLFILGVVFYAFLDFEIHQPRHSLKRGTTASKGNLPSSSSIRHNFVLLSSQKAGRERQD